jgi:hypothetical protein
MEDNLMRRRKRQRHCYEKSIFRQRNAKVQFSEIPEVYNTEPSFCFTINGVVINLGILTKQSTESICSLLCRMC